MKKLLMVCMMALMVTSAQAAVVTPTSAAVDYPLPAPVSLISDAVTSTTQVRLYDGQQDVTLGSDLAVDTGSDIPAGTKVNVYLVHFNPGTGNSASLIDSIIFDQPILGLIFDEANLDLSDSLGPVTVYNGARDFEIPPELGTPDSAVITGGGLVVDFDIAAGGLGIDEIRIIELAENSIVKTLTVDGGDDVGEIGIYKPTTTQYEFEITYAGPAAVVVDTVPAEFEITGVDTNDGTASFDRANKKGGPKAKSAMIIEWEVPAGLSTLTVSIETRESPGKGHKKGDKGPVFKPTSCDPVFELNDGAIAYDPVDYALGILTPILDPTDPLSVAAVCGVKPCAPESVLVTCSDTEAEVSWTSIVCDDDVDYYISRSIDGAKYSEIAGGPYASPFTDSLPPLDDGDEVCYKVIAVYNSGLNEGNENSAEGCCTYVAPVIP